jgi:ElaA protein
MDSTTFTYKSFVELTAHELYAILKLRSEVFVVEQNCVFLDADDKDQLSYHIMAWQNNLLVGYTRLVPAGIAYTDPSIGRVVVSSTVRNTGLGRSLMQFSIRTLYNLWGKTTITIGAQLYLRKFYESLGFQQKSEVYPEDGIEHIKMILPGLR